MSTILKVLADPVRTFNFLLILNPNASYLEVDTEEKKSSHLYFYSTLYSINCVKEEMNRKIAKSIMEAQLWT